VKAVKTDKKHPCPDCHMCQGCSDARCAACQGWLVKSTPGARCRSCRSTGAGKKVSHVKA
jgi:hypothetical protein